MAELVKTIQLVGELGADAARMQSLSFSMNGMGFKDTAKRLDADAVILLKMQERLMAALREDGVKLGG